MATQVHDVNEAHLRCLIAIFEELEIVTANVYQTALQECLWVYK